jgi:hypothetical protein
MWVFLIVVVETAKWCYYMSDPMSGAVLRGSKKVAERTKSDLMILRVRYLKSRVDSSRVISVFMDVANMGHSAARVKAIREQLPSSFKLFVVWNVNDLDIAGNVKVVFQEISGVEFVEGGLLEILCKSEDSFFVSNDLYRNLPEATLVKMGIDQLWIEARRLEFLYMCRGRICLTHHDLLLKR